jgi:hypothetical protein
MAMEDLRITEWHGIRKDYERRVRENREAV